MDKLLGKNVIISGGGTGIGREIALLFAREGANVVVCGRRREPLDKTVKNIESLGRKALAVSADIGQEEDIIRVVSGTMKVCGSIDVLVNNASIVGQVAPVVDLITEQWEQVLKVNLTGTMIFCREVLKCMREQQSGNIVNVSSNVGRRGFPNRAPYVCSKWAMNGLTQTLARENGAYGIRVNTICPGPVLTERLAGSIQKMAQARGISVDDVRAEWEQEAPLGRFATTEECARVCLFLACDDSSGMTGQALNVTAGALMS